VYFFSFWVGGCVDFLCVCVGGGGGVAWCQLKTMLRTAGSEKTVTITKVITTKWLMLGLTLKIIAKHSNKEYMLFSGNEIVPYESPRPPAGIHRIVFVLFKQQARQTVYAPGWRQNFNIRDFSAIYNLGAPVAALYFNCQKESGVGGRR
jgi:hypothetical protein